MPRKKKQAKIHSATDEMGSDLNQFVTTSEAAELLGVLTSSVDHLLYSGRIKGKKIGRDWLVYRPSLETYLDSKSNSGRPSLKPRKLNPKK